MNFNNKYMYCFVLTAMLMLTSCFTEKIDLDLNSQENKKVVISAWLNDMDDDQLVSVSYSLDYLGDFKLDPIEDAVVSLSYDSEVINLVHSAGGKYLLPPDWKGAIGTRYELLVSHGGKEYESSSELKSMPEAQDIESVYEESESGEGYYGVYFGFQETAGEGDGYFVIDYKKDSDQKNIIRTGGWTNDEFGDGEYFQDLTVTQNYHQVGDTVILELHSIGRKATEYFESITTEIFREGLLDPPPVNVPTNISSGAVGYFLTSGKRQYEIIIQE